MIAQDCRPFDWGSIKLVAFDVDGTLYDQGRVRLRMAKDIMLHSVLKRDLVVPLVLNTYRRIRERMGDEETSDFEPALIAETARLTDRTPDMVRAITAEWIEERPLAYIAAARYPGLSELVAGLKRSGKIVGVLSDYPAHDKLLALEFASDHVVSSGDDGIGVLKPHERGLECLMALAGVSADATLVIGDRADRDGIVARRVGARALIRTSKPLQDWHTFRRFEDPVFMPVLV
jgi:FMN phosphatase YigB (HAD superfamily)